MVLYESVQQSENFDNVRNMDHKEQDGREFKIIYKVAPMSIGLFLFDRLPNNEMVLEEYFRQYQESIMEIVTKCNY